MNRREALAALVSLPEIARISTTGPLQPDDVIVVECDGVLSQRVIENIRTQLREIWPGRKIVVCDQAMRIKVMAGSG